jgi:prephenate dehydrogenase
MAGSQDGGAEHASAGLFRQRPWILCPEGSAPDALERVEAFVRGLGAVPRRLSAAAHDRAVALTSHVPQLLASALACRAAERAVEAAAGPGFESATRVAGGGEAMWRDILATNADEVEAALAEVVNELAKARAGLRRVPPDLAGALALLERARAHRSRGSD